MEQKKQSRKSEELKNNCKEVISFLTSYKPNRINVAKQLFVFNQEIKKKELIILENDKHLLKLNIKYLVESKSNN